MRNNTSTSKSLLILLWNAIGLYNHLLDFSFTLYEKRIDTELISETHFITRTKIHIPGYIILKSNYLDGTTYRGWQ